MKINNHSVSEFVAYVLSFYAAGQIYDENFVESEVLVALGILVASHGVSDFEGDSVDRERVRDIVLGLRENKLIVFGTPIEGGLVK